MKPSPGRISAELDVILSSQGAREFTLAAWGVWGSNPGPFR